MDRSSLGLAGMDRDVDPVSPALFRETPILSQKRTIVKERERREKMARGEIARYIP
jgi:hypothetical protein